jgi:RHS repeat-associated protein
MSNKYSRRGFQQTWESGYDPALKFSGKERDTESGLDYFGARYYDHTLYRFLSVDPVVPAGEAVADPQRWNLYAYCGGNPINYIDPDGNIIIMVYRYKYGSNATYGVYVVRLGESTLLGYTLEPALGVGKGPIPIGIYKAESHWWQRKKYQVFWLQDVPGFEGIFIHRGNKPEHTLACLLAGKTLQPGGGGIGDSKKALDELMWGITQYTADFTKEAIDGGFLDLDLLHWLFDCYVLVCERGSPTGTVTTSYEVSRIL